MWGCVEMSVLDKQTVALAIKTQVHIEDAAKIIEREIAALSAEDTITCSHVFEPFDATSVCMVCGSEDSEIGNDMKTLRELKKFLEAIRGDEK